MTIKQKQLLRSVDQFIDACSRYRLFAERPKKNFSGWRGMEGIDWTEIRKHLSNELKVVVRGVESATDRLLKDANAMDATYPEKWRTIIRSAAILARSALESTHKDGRWTNPTYLKKSLDDIFDSSA